MAQKMNETCRRTLTVDGKEYDYFSLAALAEQYPGLKKLPYSLKVLLENLLRNQDNASVTEDDITRLAKRAETGGEHEIAYRPARVLMQDFTGVPDKSSCVWFVNGNYKTIFFKLILNVINKFE